MSAPRRHAGANLMLAAAIGLTWLAVHVGCIFFWEWRIDTAPVAIVAVLAQTWLSTGLFIIAHDCMHESLAPGRRRLNDAIGALCLMAYAGLSYRSLYPKHQAHHHAPGTERDPDFHPREPHRAWPWFIQFFKAYYTHAQILRITMAAVIYLLLGASLVNIVTFWALPAMLALAQLFVFGTYLPHRHEEAGFADGHRARSNDWPPLASLLTCFHFGAYHHEHHLNPGTPWWRLPRVRADLRARR